MSCRSKLAELLPLYAAGSLGEEERRAVAAHLAACADCRAELAFWQEVASAVAAEDRLLPAPSPNLVDRALVGAQRRRANPFVRAWGLLAAQVPLVRREIWSASALVMALGCLVAILQGGSASASIIEAVAPVVAAAGLAMLYGPESDPGLELALATPTSPRQVLLARLVVVYGYDLILGVAASVGVLAVVPAGLLGQLILGWLAPMAFLSALALVLSMVIGTGNAITAALMLWLARGLASGLRIGTMGAPAALEAAFVAALQAYAGLWQRTGLLFALAAALLAVAVALAGQGERLVAQKA